VLAIRQGFTNIDVSVLAIRQGFTNIDVSVLAIRQGFTNSKHNLEIANIILFIFKVYFSNARQQTTFYLPFPGFVFGPLVMRFRIPDFLAPKNNDNYLPDAFNPSQNAIIQMCDSHML
jgi:hypothetical protein